MNADTKNLFTKAYQAGTFDNIRTTIKRECVVPTSFVC